MPATDALNSLPPAPAYRLPGVNLFASGMYRGQPWPPARVQGIADNIRKLGPSGKNLIIPPAVLGHEEDQDWLEDTSLPAAGWVDPDSVTTIPDPENPAQVIIKGDVVNIPPEAAARIHAGEYANGSGEFYELLDDFGKPQGYTMRRFGLLGGGTIPQVKRLGRLPPLEPMTELVKFAEIETAVERVLTLNFSERTTMDRTAAMAAIKAAMPGLAQATLDALSDDQLKDMVANLPAAATLAPAGGQMDDATPPSRDDMIAKLTAKGQDPATCQAMSDADLQNAYSTVMADDPDAAKKTDPPTPPPAAPADDKKIAAMSEAATKSLNTIKRIEVEAKSKLDAANKREKAVKTKDAESFCEGLVKAGKLLPHQKQDYVSILTNLDDSTSLHKFAENGITSTLTAFELKKKQLEQRPRVVVFGEKIPGGGQSPQDAKSAAMAKATEFAQLNGHAFRNTAFKNAEGFVQKFSELYDKDPAQAMGILA